jgi:MFS family permease
MSRRRVALAGVLHFLFSVSITFLDTVFLVYAVTQLRLDPSVAMLMLAARGIANAVVRSPAGSISDRFGQKWPFVISFSSLILSYVLLATSTDIWLMGLAMVILGAAWGVRVVLEWTATQDEIPAKSKSIASTFLPLVWDVAHSSGALAVGALALFAPETTIFLFSAALMLVATIVVLAFWPSKSSV